MINIMEGQRKYKEDVFKKRKEVRQRMFIINMEDSEEALKYIHLQHQLSTLVLAGSPSLCTSRRSVVMWYHP